MNLDISLAIAVITPLIPIIGCIGKLLQAYKETTENWVKLNYRLDRIEEEIRDLKSHLR
jgi:hypothetical protein